MSVPPSFRVVPAALAACLALFASPAAAGDRAAEGAPRAVGAADTTPPAVLVLSPNSPQVWAMGTLRRISWKATDAGGVAAIDVHWSPDSGATWQPIGVALPPTGFHVWKVANVATRAALIRVTARDSAGNAASDASDRTFEIKDRLAPTMAVTTPNGGQVWAAGSVRKLTWKATDNVGVTRVDLSYSVNGGATWTTIASRLANSGFYSWKLPANVASATALVKAAAADSAGNASSDVSNAFFEIRDETRPAITVTTPNGGQVWEAGTTRKVTWKATDNLRVVAVDLDWSPDSGATWNAIQSGLFNSGGYLWTVSGPISRRALMRATARDSMGNAASDVSNAPFEVRDTTPPTVTLRAPAGGEVWEAGAEHEIAWTSSDHLGTVAADLELSVDGGLTWTEIARALPDSGRHAWRVPAVPAPAARVRVTVRDAAGNAASDTSDAPFTLRAPEPPPPPPAPPPADTVAPYRVVALRADSASGAGPYAAPGAASPWVDLAGPHDAVLWGFDGNAASGWMGDGTPGNPHRLEFAGEEPGWNNRVVIPAGTVPELQTVGPLTAAVWFRTGHDGPSPLEEYVLEWVQHPRPDWHPEYEGRGMSIMVQNGAIQVYANPWIEVAPARPWTWYHVAVAKDTGDLRIYVNGVQRFAGDRSHRGIQQSDLVLGASTYRVFDGYEGELAFSHWFGGAIGQFELWRGALGDSAVLAWFRADSARFLAALPAADAGPVVRLEAARADGAAPHPPGAGDVAWVDLAGERDDFALLGFAADSAGGFAGDGSAADPFRLRFDGLDDVAVLDPAQVPELLAAPEHTLEMVFAPGPDVASSTPQYLVEWLHAVSASPGMSVAIWEGKLRLYAGSFAWIELGEVAPETWHRLVVAKRPGEVRAWLDGVEVHASSSVNFGAPYSGVVLGGSTWRGPGSHGDHFRGAIGSAAIWARALSAEEVAAGDSGAGAPALRARAAPETAGSGVALALDGARPNPARGALRVHFALPDGAPARLELIDVGGRRLAARPIGALGPGRHAVTLAAPGALRAGVYWVRLVRSGAVLTRKAIVVE